MTNESVVLGAQLRRIRSIWERRWHLAVLGVSLPLAAVVGLVPFLPNVYRASAIVLVERQQVPESLVKSTVTSELETRMTTMTQEILSRPRLERLLDELRLYPSLRHGLSRESLVDRMRRDIDVDLRGVDSKVRGGQISAFTVSYKGDDRNTVAQVANALAGYYLEENTRAREQLASGTARFLRTQLDEVKDRLQVQEARVSEFKRRHMGETPQHVQGNLGMLEQLSMQLRLNGENQNRAMERRETLARQLAEAERAAGTSVPARGVLVDPRVTRLTRLREELAELRTRFTDRYPDIVRLRSEIASLEATLGAPSRAGGGPSPGSAPPETAPASPYTSKLGELLDEAEAQVRALKTEETRLREQLAVYQRRVENAPRLEQQLQDLSRDYDTTSELYRSLLKRHDEAELAESLEQRQKGELFRILEPAIDPAGPWAPNRPRLILLGLALAVALGVGVALLAEHLDASYHTVDELRAQVSPPIVARIPRITSDRDRRRGRWRLALGGVLTSMLLMTVVGVSYLTASGRVPVVSDVVMAALLRR
jgi:polysaccharide chain length determinant protein (PEP-CTERM system associated)